MDNLTLEMRACEKAGFGVSYGKWKATQPVVDAPKRKTSGKVRTCEYCGKEIFDKYNRNRKYCDDNCRSNAWYKRVYVDEKKKRNANIAESCLSTKGRKPGTALIAVPQRLITTGRRRNGKMKPRKLGMIKPCLPNSHMRKKNPFKKGKKK